MAATHKNKSTDFGIRVHRFESQLYQIPSPLFAICVTFSKLLNLLVL